MASDATNASSATRAFGSPCRAAERSASNALPAALRAGSSATRTRSCASGSLHRSSSSTHPRQFSNPSTRFTPTAIRDPPDTVAVGSSTKRASSPFVSNLQTVRTNACCQRFDPSGCNRLARSSPGTEQGTATSTCAAFRLSSRASTQWHNRQGEKWSDNGRCQKARPMVGIRRRKAVEHAPDKQEVGVRGARYPSGNESFPPNGGPKVDRDLSRHSAPRARFAFQRRCHRCSPRDHFIPLRTRQKLLRYGARSLQLSDFFETPHAAACGREGFT